jgi:hypothetical protein
VKAAAARIAAQRIDAVFNMKRLLLRDDWQQVDARAPAGALT